MTAARTERREAGRKARAIPLASWVDDWGRWFLRCYFVGSLCCLCAFTAISFFPTSRSRLLYLTASLFVPLAVILTSLVLRLRAGAAAS